MFVKKLNSNLKSQKNYFSIILLYFCTAESESGSKAVTPGYSSYIMLFYPFYPETPCMYPYITAPPWFQN